MNKIWLVKKGQLPAQTEIEYLNRLPDTSVLFECRHFYVIQTSLNENEIRATTKPAKPGYYHSERKVVKQGWCFVGADQTLVDSAFACIQSIYPDEEIEYTRTNTKLIEEMVSKTLQLIILAQDLAGFDNTK